MGQIFTTPKEIKSPDSVQNSETDGTIGWNKRNTDSPKSSDTSNTSKMAIDVKKLLNKIEEPTVTTTEFDVSKILNSKMSNSKLSPSKLPFSNTSSESSSDVSIGDEYMNPSSTSPFISPSEYKGMQKENLKNMRGGAVKKMNEDDSDTSDTSSSGLPEKTKPKKQQKSHTNLKAKVSDLDNKLATKSTRNIKSFKNKSLHNKSYVSSSAHTNGSYSDSIGGSNVSDSSIENENNISVSSTVRTSQINLISE